MVHKRYDRIKCSEVEWIGEIPEHWEENKLKTLFNFEKGKNAAKFTKEYIDINKGQYPVYSGQTENNGVMGYVDNYEYDLEECLFTTTVGAKAMTPMYLKGKFNLSQNCLIMISKQKDIMPRYYYYQLYPLFSFERSLIPSYMQPSLRISDLKSYVVLKPPVEEQKAISSLLDRKTAEINGLIEDNGKLIKALELKRQVIISDAVTRGLSSNVKLKDTGIEWIGEIPESWEVCQINRMLSEITDGAHVSPETENGEFHFISVVDLKENKINFEDSLKTSKRSYEYLVNNGCKPKHGDVLFSKDGTIGKSIAINFTKEFVVASSLIIMSPKQELNFYYLDYLLKSNVVQAQLGEYLKGAALKRISIKSTKRLLGVFPPIKNQEEIVDFLNQKIPQIDQTIIEIKAHIERLKTYKQSLIYEVVTGKIDVRNLS